MAALERELFSWLLAQTGLTPGTQAAGARPAGQLFRGPYPPEGPDECAALLWRGGTDADPTEVARPRFQVLVRGRTQDQAHALLLKVLGALASNYAHDLGDHDLYASKAESVGYIGQDQKGRYEYSANFRLATDRVL